MDRPDEILYVVRGSCPLRLPHGRAYTLAQVQRIALEQNLNLTDGYGRSNFRQARRLRLLTRQGREMARFDQDTRQRDLPAGRSGAALALLLLAALLWPGSLQAQTWAEKALAAVLVGEAGNQGSNGMVAVAEVIVERANDGRSYFGSSIYSVISKPKAFSCLNHTTMERLVRKSSRSSSWKTALNIAILAYRAPNQLPGLSQRANGFTRKEERPKWAKGRRPVVVIKDHAFYRIP